MRPSITLVTVFYTSVFFGLACPASADPVTFKFSGMISSVTPLAGSPPSEIYVGAGIQFEYTFDDAAIPNHIDPQLGSYYTSVGIPYGFALTVDDLIFTSNEVTFRIGNDKPQGGLGVPGDSYLGRSGSTSQMFLFEFNFVDPSGTSLSSEDLVTTQSRLSSFSQYGGVFRHDVGSPPSVQPEYMFSFTAVPEPSTLVLLGIGLVGVIGYGWTGKHSGETNRDR